MMLRQAQHTMLRSWALRRLKYQFGKRKNTLKTLQVLKNLQGFLIIDKVVFQNIRLRRTEKAFILDGLVAVLGYSNLVPTGF